MPRDANGVFTPKRNWRSDADDKVPFDPDKWDEQDEDFATALNDLPLKSVVPTVAPPGTDPTAVNPGSFMEEAGMIYYRPSYGPVWVDISTPGVPDRAYTEGSAPPPNPAVADIWRDATSGAIYCCVDAIENLWQQIG